MVTKKDHNDALRAWALNQSGKGEMVRSEWQESAHKVGMNLNSGTLTIRLADSQPKGLEEIRRTSDAITNASYSDNVNLIQGVEKRLLYYANVRKYCNTVRTGNANNLPWLTNDDTGNTGALRNNLDVITSTGTTLGKVVLTGWSIGSGTYYVAQETIEDSGVDLTELIADNLATRIGRKESYQFCLGAGTTTHQGYTKGITAATWFHPSTSADFADVFYAMYPSLDVNYRDSESAAWAFSDHVLAAIMRTTDAIGRPLWNVSLAVGMPDTILGKKYFIDNNLGDESSTTTPTVVFGDWAKFLVRDIREVTVNVIRPNTDVNLAEMNAVAFIGNHRSDSAVLQSNAFVSACANTGSAINCGTAISIGT